MQEGSPSLSLPKGRGRARDRVKVWRYLLCPGKEAAMGSIVEPVQSGAKYHSLVRHTIVELLDAIPLMHKTYQQMQNLWSVVCGR